MARARCARARVCKLGGPTKLSGAPISIRVGAGKWLERGGGGGMSASPGGPVWAEVSIVVVPGGIPRSISARSLRGLMLCWRMIPFPLRRRTRYEDPSNPTNMPSTLRGSTMDPLAPRAPSSCRHRQRVPNMYGLRRDKLGRAPVCSSVRVQALPAAHRKLRQSQA